MFRTMLPRSWYNHLPVWNMWRQRMQRVNREKNRIYYHERVRLLAYHDQGLQYMTENVMRQRVFKPVNPTRIYKPTMRYGLYHLDESRRRCQ
jgi:hypothetical protein